MLKRNPAPAGFFFARMGHNPRMDKRLRIAVIGYGTAGQALSVLLGRDGHHVET